MTESEIYFAGLRCDVGHRISVSPKDVQPGTVVYILRLNTVIPCPRRYSIHGDKDRHLPCACAALRLEQMPDIILFRDCTLLSFLFLPFSCFPRFFIMMPFSKVRHFWFQCCPVAFLNIGEAIFIWCVPEPCGSVGVACQNKRVAKGHSRRSGKISTLRVVFFRLAVNIPSFVPHAFQVSSNSNNHTVFGRMRLKKSPHRYESHRTTYK